MAGFFCNMETQQKWYFDCLDHPVKLKNMDSNFSSVSKKKLFSLFVYALTYFFVTIKVSKGIRPIKKDYAFESQLFFLPCTAFLRGGGKVIFHLLSQNSNSVLL